MNGDLLEIIYSFILSIFTENIDCRFMDFNQYFYSALAEPFQEGANFFMSLDLYMQEDGYMTSVQDGLVAYIITWIIAIILIVLLFKLFKWIFNLIFKLFKLN